MQRGCKQRGDVDVIEKGQGRMMLLATYVANNIIQGRTYTLCNVVACNTKSHVAAMRKVPIRIDQCSWYGRHVQQLVWTSCATVGMDAMCDSWYGRHVRQLVWTPCATVGMDAMCDSWYGRHVRQLVWTPCATVGMDAMCDSWYGRHVRQLVWTSCATVGMDAMCDSWYGRHVRQLVWTPCATVGMDAMCDSWYGRHVRQLVWTPCATVGMDAMCDSDEGLLAAPAACAVIACRQTNRKRRCWTQPWLRRRQMSGACHCSKPCSFYFPSPQRWHAVLTGDAPSYGSTRYQCSINNRAHGTTRPGKIPGHPSAEHLASCQQPLFLTDISRYVTCVGFWL